MVKLLQKNGIQVDIPRKSVCCGVPAIASGDPEDAHTMITKNLQQMPNANDYQAILVLCPTCGGAIKNEFADFTEKNPDLYKKSKQLSSKVTPFGKYLEKLNIKFKVKSNLKVTYHTPCHNTRSLDYTAQDFLQSILGKNFVPLKDSNVCCGFGGTYSLDFANISNGILNKKIENIENTHADIVVTDCVGCVMQINGGMMYKGKKIQVMHLSEFIENHLEIIS